MADGSTSNLASTPRDYRWQRIFDNVPSEFLTNLAKSRKGHKLENLTKGQEVLVDEVFRVCDSKMLTSLYEQFVGLNGPVWYYAPESRITRKAVSDAVHQNVEARLANVGTAITGRTPQLYRVDSQTDSILFQFSAVYGVQNIRTGLSEHTKVEVLNEYTSIVHFSDPRMIVVGPYTSEKAASV